jgi:hypothetical protein
VWFWRLLTSDADTRSIFDEVYRLLPDHTESLYHLIYPGLGFDLAQDVEICKGGSMGIQIRDPKTL